MGNTVSLKSVICNMCSSEMVPDDRNKPSFWHCPICTSEFWPKVKILKPTPDIMNTLVKAKSHKGGSRSKGRSGAKEKLKKQSTQALFNRLYQII